jgi:hypothetical protein
MIAATQGLKVKLGYAVEKWIESNVFNLKTYSIHFK